jgi:hypothetical protein
VFLPEDDDGFSLRDRVFGLVILVLFIALVLTFVLPKSIFGPGLGDEVKGFPVDEMSLTVWNWTVADGVNVTGIAQLGAYDKYVVLSVSLRNIADHPVYFGRNDTFNESLEKAKTKTLLLESVKNVGKGEETDRALAQTSALDMGWGITLTNKLTFLGPNQSVNGFLYFMIYEYNIPKRLVCNDVGKGDVFSVDLTG